MQKLDRTGTATRFVLGPASPFSISFYVLISNHQMLFICYSIVGSLGTSLLNGATPVQPPILPFQEQPVLSTSGLSNVALPAVEPIGIPSECLLLKNMFDPSSEVCGPFSFFFLLCIQMRWQLICLFTD